MLSRPKAVVMSEEQDPGTPAETVERVTESYENSQRAYSAVSSPAEEQPPVPREEGLFAAIPPWDSPAESQPPDEE
jgi:hypothetical protein